MGISCTNCGTEWERDPALEVACPSCAAEVGQRCRRPSGHPVNMGTQLRGIHAAREQHALGDGILEPCPANASTGFSETASKNTNLDQQRDEQTADESRKRTDRTHQTTLSS